MPICTLKGLLVAVVLLLSILATKTTFLKVMEDQIRSPPLKHIHLICQNLPMPHINMNTELQEAFLHQTRTTVFVPHLLH